MLSVVIACYNGAATIGDQLEALATQPCSVPFEVIVADNGSTDNSRHVILRYADRLSVRVIDASAVKGPAHARNRGVAEAAGDVVAFCDADDIVADGWLESVVTAMRSHDFVAGRVELRRLNSEAVARSRRMDQEHGLQESHSGLPFRHAGAGNMAIKRSIFVDVGGFDESLRVLEDTDFCWRVQLAGVPLVFAPDMVVHVRQRSTARQNLRQGLEYGKGHAVLESRYGRAPATPGEPQRPQSHIMRLARSVTRSRDLRGLLWHIGYHYGHRFHGKPPVSEGRDTPRDAAALAL